MIWLTDGDLKRVLGTMARVFRVPFVDEGPSSFRIHLDRLAPIARTPAKSDELIELVPIPEGIVGRVHQQDASSAFDVVDESLAGGLGPVLPIVIHDDDVMGREIRLPSLPTGAEGVLGRLGLFLVGLGVFLKSRLHPRVNGFRGPRCAGGGRGGSGCGVDGEPAGCLEGGPQRVGGDLPIVVVAAVHDEHRNFMLCCLDVLSYAPGKSDQNHRQAANKK